MRHPFLILEAEIKEVVASSGTGFSPDTLLQDPRPDLCTSIVVTSRRSADEAICMRTYGTNDRINARRFNHSMLYAIFSTVIFNPHPWGGFVTFQ